MNGNKLFKVLVCIALVLASVGLFTPRVPGDPLSAQAYQTNVYLTDGGDKLVIASGGEIEIQSGATADYQEGATYTLPAADQVLIDGASTANTGTAGIFDVNHGTITANASAVNIAETVNTGATGAADNFAMVVTLTQDDADADLFGISMTAAATTNAAAGSYEAGFLYDCAENTAGACLDGVRLTAGTATGMTDGLDASDADIVNAVNIGVNPILGSNADTLFLGLTDHHLTLTGDEAAAVTFIGADDSGAADTIFDTTGAGAITVGSVDVTVITLSTDDTGNGTDLVLPAQSVNNTEMLNDTITFAQISDSSAIDADTDFTMADGIELSLTPSYTTGDTEALLIDIDQVDDGAVTDDVYAFKIDATSESGDAGDLFYGIGIVWEQGTANTIMDAAIAIDNEETTVSTLTDGVIVTSSGVDTGVTDAFDASATNILNALNAGANNILGDEDDLITIGGTDDTLLLTSNDATPIFQGADAGGASDTIFDTTGAGEVHLGSTDVTAATLIGLTADFEIGGGDVERFDYFSTPAGVGLTESILELWDITGVYTTGMNTVAALNIDLELGDASAGTNNIYGVLIDNLDRTDSDTTESAIAVGGTNWDYAFDTGGNLILGGDDTLSIGITDDTVIFGRSESGTGTYTCEDDDANAECIFAGGGIGISTLGTSSNVSAQILTDGTGDAELAVPENSIGPDEVAVMHDRVIFCGEADENGTIYYGPAVTEFGGGTSAITYTIAAAGCDALDNATEGTADAPIMTNVAFKVTGLFCKQDGTLASGEAITFTVRSATADLTPTVTCVVGEGETDCRSLTGSTTDVAAGATVAVKAVQTSNNGDGDNHWCKVYIALK